jgi:hypothetical protein
MLPRLLPVACLIFLFQVSFTQQSATTEPDGVPDTCLVTKPSDEPFVPPFPKPAKQAEDSFSFGTDRLWTQLPADGTWRGLPHYLFFGRQGYDAHEEPEPKLRVTARRLDSPAPPLFADPDTSGWVHPDQQYMIVGINFPTLGCWEITGHYEDDGLTFVVWIPQ